VITARRSAGEPGTDLLGLLLQARDEDGSALSDEELRNQVVTFLLAGHETTATLVTWAFCLLSQNPGARGAVEAELDRVIANQTPAALGELLPQLPHLHATLQETLRLYPSIWIAERRVIAADPIGGYTIPAGSAVVVSPYVTQRLPALWPDPDRFDLSRWLTGEPRSLGRDGYFPFGAGPHLCIGQHFAMMEAKIILATLLARFRVHLVEDALPPPLGGITLRPAGAVPVHVERR
jgi:cytochrome P450